MKIIILFIPIYLLRIDYKTKKKLLSDINNHKDLKFLPHLELTLGSRVMYQNNNEPQLGLFNGAMGTVVGFYYMDNCVDNNE